MHHKHGSGDTVTFYGTEGPGVAFIGNKGNQETSEGGAMALKLFRKFMEGKPGQFGSTVYIFTQCIELIRTD